jgi:hypothetical protein
MGIKSQTNDSRRDWTSRVRIKTSMEKQFKKKTISYLNFQRRRFDSSENMYCGLSLLYIGEESSHVELH